jgi:hypothetical protein
MVLLNLGRLQERLSGPKLDNPLSEDTMSTAQRKRPISTLLLLTLLSMIVVAKPQTSWAQKAIQIIPILSGSGWVVTTNPGPDCPALDCLLWTTIDYDDSTWAHPVLSTNNGVTNTSNVVPGTKALFMWYPDRSELVAYFRYKFTINANTQSLIGGRAYVEADDYYELWVNGHFVISGRLGQHLQGGNWLPQIADITPYLQAGQNVIAIRANDGGCKSLDPETGLCSGEPFAPDGTYSGNPFRLGFRNLFFDGVVRNSSTLYQ